VGHEILAVGITGTALTDLERRILRESPPYGVILFGRNVESVDQLQALVRDIKTQSDTPPLVMIDQEGGRVDRLRTLIPGFPSAEAFSERKDNLFLAGWFGRVIGLSLRFFDIDVNLAPVLDLRRGEAARGLERRCWGSDAETVITLAGEFMREQIGTGVAACLKHFPGIGAGLGDSHYGPAVIPLGEEQLVAEDLAPYFALSDEAGAVMIGHGLYPELEDASTPASLSPLISRDLLRDRVGFRGVSLSDDMEMHAVSDLGSYEAICERALLAGNDVILLCSHVEMAPGIMAHIEERAATDGEMGVRFDEALRRGEEFRRRCHSIRRSAIVQPGTFEELLEEVAKFRDAFDAASPDDGSGEPSVERRQTPRTPGTGRTGREEWT
jgi:beta-N-acetylhexosaminidase